MKNLLKGKLTYLGGFGMILTGAGGLILGFVQPDSNGAMNYEVALAMIFAGLTAVGFRRNQK